MPEFLGVEGGNPRNVELGPEATYNLPEHRTKLAAAVRALVNVVQKKWLLFGLRLKAPYCHRL